MSLVGDEDAISIIVITMEDNNSVDERRGSSQSNDDEDAMDVIEPDMLNDVSELSKILYL